jgi:hypothetical protein
LLSYDSTTIGEIINLTPPPVSCEDIDVTTTDSDIEETKPADVTDCGTLTFDQVWHPNDTNHEIVETAYANRSVLAEESKNWVITYPFTTAVSDTFTGYVNNIGPQTIGPKDSIKRSVTVKLTSVVTRA